MKTMGLSRLVLVAPERAPERDPTRWPPAPTTCSTAPPPVADPGRGRRRLPLGAGLHRAQPPRRAGRTAAARGRRARAGARPRAGAEVALVFGRERTGLTNDELQLLPRRRAHPGQPRLQLAQPGRGGAGAELRVAPGDAGARRAGAGAGATPIATSRRPRMPSWKASSASSARPWTTIDFHKGRAPESAMRKLRRLFLRAEPGRARGAPAARHPRRRRSAWRCWPGSALTRTGRGGGLPARRSAVSAHACFD